MKMEDLLQGGLRALFCFGINHEFFAESQQGTKAVADALKEAFNDLEGRFGVKVLGTFDDDLLQCGVSGNFPWISYILAEIPSMEAAIAVNNLIRNPVGDARLAKYIRVETRIGRPLFFGQR